MTTKNKITYKNKDILQLQILIDDLSEIKSKYFALYLMEVSDKINSEWVDTISPLEKQRLELNTECYQIRRDGYDFDHTVRLKAEERLRLKIKEEHIEGNKQTSMFFDCIKFDLLPEINLIMLRRINEFHLIDIPSKKDLERLRKLNQILKKENNQ